MKVKILFVSLFLSLLLFGQQENSQSLIFYNFKFRQDSTNLDKKFDEVMVLLIGNKQSLYKSYQKLKRDSLIKNNLNKGIYEINFSNLPKTNVFHQILRDYEKDSIKIYDRIASKDFVFGVEKIKWKLGKEKKTISGFDCQNAFCNVGGRDFEAWFTTSLIPNEGPYRFKGLPGLVLEVYDKKSNFEITFMGIKNLTYPIELNNLSIKTNKEKFLKSRKEFYADPIGQSQLYFGRVIPEQNRERIKQNVQKENIFKEQ